MNTIYDLVNPAKSPWQRGTLHIFGTLDILEPYSYILVFFANLFMFHGTKCIVEPKGHLVYGTTHHIHHARAPQRATLEQTLVRHRRTTIWFNLFTI